MTTTTGEARGPDPAAQSGRAVPADTYAHRLMLARAHAGNLSIRTAAELCGLNHANWANWEQGIRSRTVVEDVEAISEGLGIDRNWLLFGGPLAVADSNGRGRKLRRRGTGGYPCRAGQASPSGHTRPPTRRDREGTGKGHGWLTSQSNAGRNPRSRPPGYPTSGLREAA